MPDKLKHHINYSIRFERDHEMAKTLITIWIFKFIIGFGSDSKKSEDRRSEFPTFNNLHFIVDSIKLTIYHIQYFSLL
jgi:hypothetical protein